MDDQLAGSRDMGGACASNAKGSKSPLHIFFSTVDFLDASGMRLKLGLSSSMFTPKLGGISI